MRDIAKDDGPKVSESGQTSVQPIEQMVVEGTHPDDDGESTANDGG